MKTLIKSFLILSISLTVVSCHDLEELNLDPNKPSQVSTATLMTGAEKRMMDYIYDNWFSGRQALVYSQYWAQRNYTEEDRYQIRESVNNNYFNQLFAIAGNLNSIVELNTNEATKAEMALYGNNDNQIAAAMILKVWLMQVMADTWGSIPYSEAFKLEEGVVYAKYDDLNDLYSKFISELDEAVAMIDESDVVFNSGDLIYDGDASKWKKFGNSLKCRIAIRLSKVDPQWKSYITEAIASGVFEDNSDNADFRYLKTSPNQCFFYQGFIIEARNDFSIAKPFVDLLQGQPDVLNGKSHPWENVVDPRLALYTSARNDKYIGIPYGVPSNQMTRAIRNAAPNFYADEPLVVQSNFTVTYMTYPELCFILSEYNDFSAVDYEKGVRSSFEYWNSLNQVVFEESAYTQAEIDDYVASVTSVVNAETVATQKYIHLYMNGPEAWAEYRRTGYPSTLLKPGEVTHVVDGEEIVFEPLEEVKGDLPARVKYPTNESTLNAANFNAAVAKLKDGTNNYYSKMFWDVRSTVNPHPSNK